MMRRGVIICSAVLAASPSIASAAGVGEFYAGKTITVSTYDLPGAGYSLYVQLLLRHYGNHIPGHPNFIALNQPGAGGLIAMNHAGVLAPQDGTFLTLASQGLLIYEGTGQRGLQVSLSKFHWLGNFTQSNNVTAVWATSGIKTLQDAIAHEVITGVTGAGSASAVGPLIYNSVLGTKFKLIYGYQGSASMTLAMRRGELQARGNSLWASLEAELPDEIRNGTLNILIQTGLRKERDLPDVPLFLDLVKDDPNKEPVAKFMSYAVSIARPLAAPPGVPFNRVNILRRAFDETMKDPEFLADAARQRLDIDPMTGEEVQNVVAQVLGTPTAVRHHIQSILGLPLN